MNRGILIALLLTGVLMGALYGLSPFWAAHTLQQAAQTGDRDQLEEVIDFPAVRESLKSQVSALMLKSIRNDPKLRDNPSANLGAMLAPAITDRAIDSMITPEGMNAIINQGRINAQSQAQPTPRPIPSAASFSYRTLDRFRVELRTDPDPTFLTLERRGFFSWKLIRIDLPVSSLDSH